jgi:hypothetical protein
MAEMESSHGGIPKVSQAQIFKVTQAHISLLNSKSKKQNHES